MSGPGPGEAARVVSIRPLGDLANRMIQYMVALSLQKRIAGCVVTGARLPEWGVEGPPNPDAAGFENVVAVNPRNTGMLDLGFVAGLAEASPAPIQIVIEDYVQRMELLGPPGDYRDVFAGELPDMLGPRDLLINVRAGDILGGVSNYPLVPVEYFKWLVELTGLDPVFCGQLGDSTYVYCIRSVFPRARFIPSLGPVGDFQLIRSARHIAISVSTFSWLAAWLSQARTIFLPMCGFLSPTNKLGTDLLPTSDPRYRFIQFPLFYAMPELEMIRHHQAIEGAWREISARQVALIKTGAPFLAPRHADIPFDPEWYAHTYLDAACEISDGWFRDPMHHFLEVGRMRGCLPYEKAGTAKAQPPALTNLARRGTATQSSVCEFSREKTIEADAAIPINGRLWDETFCCTDAEDSPWWRLDLGAVHEVRLVRIYNRQGAEAVQMRLAPLVATASLDGEAWFELFRTGASERIGDVTTEPYRWSPSRPVSLRFLKLTLPRKEYLHFAEIEVFGIDLARQAGRPPRSRVRPVWTWGLRGPASDA